MRKQGLVKKAEILLGLITDLQIEIDAPACRGYLEMAVGFYRKAHKRMPDSIYDLRVRLGMEKY